MAPLCRRWIFLSRPLALVALGLIGVLTAAAPETPAAETAATETPAAETAATVTPPATAVPDEAAGLRVYRDPVTGELTSEPAPGQAQALSKAVVPSLSRSTAGLTPFPLAQGGHGVHLGGRFQSATIVHRLADGTYTFECVEGATEPHLHASPPAPLPLETE